MCIIKALIYLHAYNIAHLVSLPSDDLIVQTGACLRAFLERDAPRDTSRQRVGASLPVCGKHRYWERHKLVVQY